MDATAATAEQWEGLSGRGRPGCPEVVDLQVGRYWGAAECTLVKLLAS